MVQWYTEAIDCRVRGPKFKPAMAMFIYNGGTGYRWRSAVCSACMVKMVAKLHYNYYCCSAPIIIVILNYKKLNNIHGKKHLCCEKRHVQELKVAITIIERSNIWCDQEQVYA